MGAQNLLRLWRSRRRVRARLGIDPDFRTRYRDIVSDPLNLLIRRHPRAGEVEEGFVWLHNGVRVHVSGPHAYFGHFSDILVINRGVHEPLEEYVFQTLLERIGPAPAMLELGAYWGHYSMWLKAVRPDSRVVLVEADPDNLAAGRANFGANGMQGEFIQAFVGKDGFGVDRFLSSRQPDRIDILHADIDNYEIEMLEGASAALAGRRVDYLFVSTHGDERHRSVLTILREAGYRVEVASDGSETTSYDGLVFASSPAVDPLFPEFKVFGRDRIRGASSADLLAYLEERVKSGGTGRRSGRSGK
jgi:hypothetical protein